jgi:uncharacterized membrane protein
MPFCGTCGAPVEGRFCAKCGSPLSDGGTPPKDAAPGGNPGPQQVPLSSAPLADNVASALCYAVGLLTGIIFLVIAPYNRNRTVRFHAFQSIFAHVAVIVCYMAINMLFAFFRLFALFFVWPVLGIGLMALWIYMMVSTYQGKQVVLPVVGDLARQQAG